MNVLQFHTTDARGGGSKFVYRLHDSLRTEHDVDSTLLVREKYRSDETVEELPIMPGERRLTQFVEHVLSLDGLGSPSSFRIQRAVRNDVDLIHLHNIHGQYFNMLNVGLFPESVPILWTVHDMWAFTGKCVNSYGCQRFSESCGNCPEMNAYPQLVFDTTPGLLWLKRRLFAKNSLSFAAPSEWMEQMIGASNMSSRPTFHVPNGIDTDLFAPTETDSAKTKFDIPTDHEIVLFASGRIDNPRKGLQDLLTAVDRMKTKSQLTVLVVGGGKVPETAPDVSANVVAPGFLSNQKMVSAFNAATVLADPSYGESFGLTTTEAMACETPVVAFDVGGLGEQVTPEVGWTVEPGDTVGLQNALTESLEQSALRENKATAARKHVQNKYTLERAVDDYYELYCRLIQ